MLFYHPLFFLKEKKNFYLGMFFIFLICALLVTWGMDFVT